MLATGLETCVGAGPGPGHGPLGAVVVCSVRCWWLAWRRAHQQRGVVGVVRAHARRARANVRRLDGGKRARDGLAGGVKGSVNEDVCMGAAAASTSRATHDARRAAHDARRAAHDYEHYYHGVYDDRTDYFCFDDDYDHYYYYDCSTCALAPDSTSEADGRIRRVILSQMRASISISISTTLTPMTTTTAPPAR